MLGALGFHAALLAQQSSPAASHAAIGYVPTEGVSLTGSLSVVNGRAALANNSTLTAGDRSVQMMLARGGNLRICASTSVHLSRDAAPLAASSSPGEADASGLMVALDRGALEAGYPTGKYSDVLLTPDLRILISGPGTADLKLRVNRQGDTCVDNHGDNAPYVTVSSLMDGGVYRVQANQRVLFEHGSLQQVVDREAEPCGCPDTQPAETTLLAQGAHTGGPSSTPADTAFPTAVSEGLAPPPTGPTTPVVPQGQPHAQVAATLSSDLPLGPPPAGAAIAAPQPVSPPAAQLETHAPPQPGAQPGPQPGFFRRLRRFFGRIVGSR